jgi:hypothetical protein
MPHGRIVRDDSGTGYVIISMPAIKAGTYDETYVTQSS